MLYHHPVIGGELLNDPLTAESANAAVLLSRSDSSLTPIRAEQVGRSETAQKQLEMHQSQTEPFFQWCLIALHFLPESETLIRGSLIQARPVVAEPALTQPITRSIDRHPGFCRSIYAVDRAPHPRTKRFLRRVAVHGLAR